MRRGETKMYNGKAVQLLAFGTNGVTVRMLSTGDVGVVPEGDLKDPTEPDAAAAYSTGLTPGRVAQ